MGSVLSSSADSDPQNTSDDDDDITMIRILSLIIIIVSVSDGYKIRRSECVMSEEDESTMLCTCGGIGDPYSIIMNKGPKPELGVPWYGTRYGHNIAEQVKQHMIDLNITRVTRLHYSNCSGHYSALRVKIDFEDFPMDTYFQVVGW